ncbi:MAG: helix-turn-helix domain-containing protein [Sediminibacterium sp.]
MVHVPLSFFHIFGHLPIMAEISKIDNYIIKTVKEMRIEAGLSQIDLSQKLGMSDSFISHVETPRRRAKYNINHINALAKIFKCSPRDFFPEKPL